MKINEKLSLTRPRPTTDLSIRQQLLRTLLICLLGVILGFVSKYIDVLPHYGGWGDFLNLLSDISSRIGIWIFIATLLAAWSRTPAAAAIQVFLFFIALLLTYYLYAILVFGFFPTRYFLLWGSIAVVSPIAAYIIWYSRGKGWIAAICAALPIGALVAAGYGFLHTFSVTQGFELVLALLLYVMIPTGQKFQRLRLIPLIVVVCFIFRKFNVISLLLGALYKWII